MHSSTDLPITFPQYRRPVPQSMLLLAAALGLGAMAAFPFSVWIGAACFIAALGCYFPWLQADSHNRKARQAWLNSAKAISYDEAAAMARQTPGMFVLHVKTYPGMEQSYAAAALLNTATSEILVVDPVPANVHAEAEHQGIRIVIVE